MAQVNLQVCPSGPSRVVSHRRTTPPSVPEARIRPSEETARLSTSVPWCGRSKPRSVPASQMWSRPARRPVKTVRPSGVRASAPTGES